MALEEYKNQVVNMKKVQNSLLEKLHGCVPFYIPRYQGHMTWENVILGPYGVYEGHAL